MHRRAPPPRRHAPFLWVIGICCLAEIAIRILSGLAGTGRARDWVIQYAGFWPGLLGDWQPNFRAQPATMFASYWLIHAGLLHLAGNVVAILWLDRRLSDRLTGWQSTGIWVAAILGGAAAFGLISDSYAPMVGASGGVFGFLGADVVLRWRRDAARSGTRRAALVAGATCLAILILSLFDVVLQGGVLAWQAHLGGFVAGGLVAGLLPQSRR